MEIDPRFVVWDDPSAISWDDDKKKQPTHYDRGAQAPGYLRGMLSAFNGPTLGFGDEIIGGIAGATRTLQGNGPFRENYQDIRDFVRGAQDEEKRKNPILTPIFQAAAAAPLGMLGKATPATSLLQQTGKAALTGGMFGGVSGAGNSTADDLYGLAMDTGEGALFGAATSGAAVPVTRAVGAGVGNVAQRVNDSQAFKYAQQKIAEALARDGRGAAIRNGPNVIGQASARMDTLGPEATIADAGGANTRQLLDTLATLPGRTKDTVEAFIRSRQAGRADRLISAAEDGLNPSGLRLQDTVDDIIARRSESALPLYERLYQRVVQPRPELRQTLAAAEKLGAMREAEKIATAKRVPFSLKGEDQAMSVRDLDYVKQGLDDIINGQVDQFGKMSKYGAAVTDLKQTLVSQLDDAVGPLYKQARDAFSGPTRLIDAARNGRNFWSMDDATVTRSLRTLTEGEQDAFRIGAYEALRNKMGREAGQTEILKMWKEPATSERLKALFGDERGFRRFAAEAAKESRLKMLEGVGRGSPTAARQYGAGDLDVEAIQAAGQAVSGATSGHPLSFLSGVSGVWNRVKTPESVRDAAGQLLLSQGRQGQRGLLDMQSVLDQVQRSRSQQAGLLGLELGNIGGSFASGLDFP